MTFIYFEDLMPILVSTILFFGLSMMHKVFVPEKYTSFLQFKEFENSKRTAQSTAIRILYLIVGAIMLKSFLNYSCKQIAVGIFVPCFLNIWPAILEYHLLKFWKSREEWMLLIGYIMFVIFSVSTGIVTIEVLIPIAKGEQQLFFLDNQAVSLLMTLIGLAIPIPLESLIAKLSCVVIVQTLDTYLEQAYLIERQINIEHPKLKANKYLIDDVAKKNDININILYGILQLEIFYRERIYYRILENILCKYMEDVAIKKDISVGIAQIKISTAQSLLQTNPKNFIKDVVKDELNIELCGRYLKKIIEDYKYKNKKGEIDEQDVFDYISSEYLGCNYWNKGQTQLIYSAVLRSLCRYEGVMYMGSDVREKYRIYMFDEKGKLEKTQFQDIRTRIECIGIIERIIYIEAESFELEIYTDNRFDVETLRNIAQQYGLEVYVQ